MTKNKVQEEFDEVRAWLREHAKQVKGFEVDNTFNKGSIVAFEKEDYGPKGHKMIPFKFDSFESLKAHYGKSTKKSSVKDAAKGQERVGSSDEHKDGFVKRVVRRAFKKGE